MKTPVSLWQRFQIWRAKRMYARIVKLNRDAQLLMIEADTLMAAHAQPDLPLFDRRKADR